MQSVDTSLMGSIIALTGLLRSRDAWTGISQGICAEAGNPMLTTIVAGMKNCLPWRTFSPTVIGPPAKPWKIGYFSKKIEIQTCMKRVGKTKAELIRILDEKFASKTRARSGWIS